jgi:hypothetical protein
MRAIIGGPIAIDEIIFKLNELVENLQSNGVEEVTHMNVYFVPKAAGRTARFYLPDGNEIETLRFDEIEPKEFMPISDNIKIEPMRE